MKIRNKIINFFLAVSMITAFIPNVFAENAVSVGGTVTLYENTFDNGIESVVSVSNDFLNYDNSYAKNIIDSEIDGNKGIRVRSGSWMSSQTFLFDFTKGGNKTGINSGTITVSFDFSMDEKSPADYVIIGANMKNPSEGSRMLYFSNLKYQVLTEAGNWGEPIGKGTLLNADKVYNMRIAINLSDGKANYYLDNQFIGEQTNWSGVVVNNLSFALSGLMDYFDNLRVNLTSAEKAEANIEIYENSFDDGTESVKSVSNDIFSYDSAYAKNIVNAEFDGNKGVRVKQSAWLSSQTFLFDFTKGGEKSGIDSGIITASFDFSMDAKSPADYVIIGANMKNVSEGTRMIYFRDSKYQVLEKAGEWGNVSEKGILLDENKSYNMKFVINFSEGKAQYYLDDVLVGEQTNWTGVLVNNLSFALSGLIDYFDNLKISVKYPDAVKNIFTSENIGNIFYEDEPIEFVLSSENLGYERICEDVNVKVTDAYNQTVFDRTYFVELFGQSIKKINIGIDELKFGTYFVNVTSKNSKTFKTRFSRSVKAETLNEKSGVCAHFDGRHSMDVPGMFDIMANAGFGTVRTDWGCRLNSDGTAFDYDNNGGIFEETIKEANSHNIDILAILGITHPSYSYLSTNGGFVIDEEALSAYEEYVKTVAEDLKGKVSYFEIGNENNYNKRCATEADIGVKTIVLSNGRTLIDKNYVYTYPVAGNYNTFNTTDIKQCEIVLEEAGSYAVLNVTSKGKTLHNGTKAYVFETGENYAHILKAAYSGIKQGNPEATVLTSGSGLGYIDPDWSANRNMQEFAHGLLGQMQSENDYYFDVYATHPYHQAQPPELVDKWIMNQDWSMQAEVGNEMFEKYSVPENKRLWATEFGYSMRDTELDSSDALKKSAWVVRTMLLNEIGGYHDKMYIYDILNDGLNADNSEHNYGAICYSKNESWNNVTAYSAKPLYLAMAQYNKMLAGAEFESYTKNDVSATEKIYNAKFKRGADSVYVLWDTFNSGETVTVSDTAHNVTVYDYFGNVLQSFEDTESVTVTLGEYPVYVEFDIIDETFIEIGEFVSLVHITNNTDEEFSPAVLRIVENSDGRIIHIELLDKYYVGGELKDKVMPGEYATVECYTPTENGITQKIIVVESLENLKPLCESKMK